MTEEANLREQIAILKAQLSDSKAREAAMAKELDYWKGAHHSLNARVFGLLEQIEQLKAHLKDSKISWAAMEEDRDYWKQNAKNG